MILKCGVWRRLLRVPWTARRAKQSILKEISLGCSLEGMMLKLKLQYFGHLMWRVDSLEKTLMLGAGGNGDNRGWDDWMASLTRWTWVWVNSGSWWWTGRPGVLQFMGLQRVGHNWATELNWTELNMLVTLFYCSNCPSFYHVELVQVSVSSQHVPFSFWVLLTFWPHKISRTTLYFLWLQIGIS